VTPIAPEKNIFAMKIYKYKDLSKKVEKELTYAYEIILQKKIWCARPDSLNDKKEFCFKCDYTPTASTGRLLAKVLMHYNHTPIDQAHLMAALEIKAGRLAENAKPVLADMINQCRTTLGITCFSTSRDDSTLWKRYGGCGNGICIEIDVPDNLMNKTLFSVNYVPEKLFHIDSIFESVLANKIDEAYRNLLVTKTNYWKPEQEIRIITKQQDVHMLIDGSITEIIFGEQLPPHIIKRIRVMIDSHINTTTNS
jgi:uncharacterized membrane protein